MQNISLSRKPLCLRAFFNLNGKMANHGSTLQEVYQLKPTKITHLNSNLCNLMLLDGYKEKTQILFYKLNKAGAKLLLIQRHNLNDEVDLSFSYSYAVSIV